MLFFLDYFVQKDFEFFLIWTSEEEFWLNGLFLTKVNDVGTKLLVLKVLISFIKVVPKRSLILN